MRIKRRLYTCIVAAFLVGVGFSAPIHAQEAHESSRLDDLFSELSEAGPGDVARIEAEIVTEWTRTGSASMDLLYRRGEDAIEDGLPDIAVEHFTALVDHAPLFSEGYHGRATAYYQLGLYGPAIDDLRQVLVLEPRHFGAMTGVAIILEELERPQDALEVWQKVAEIMPADPETAAMIERLMIQLEGQAL